MPSDRSLNAFCFAGTAAIFCIGSLTGWYIGRNHDRFFTAVVKDRGDAGGMTDDAELSRVDESD